MSKRKRVEVTFSFPMRVTVPEDWDQDMIEFFFNESSHCLDNDMERAAKVYLRLRRKRPRLCVACAAGVEAVADSRGGRNR